MGRKMWITNPKKTTFFYKNYVIQKIETLHNSGYVSKSYDVYADECQWWLYYMGTFDTYQQARKYIHKLIRAERKDE